MTDVTRPNTFHLEPRRLQELKMRGVADRLYEHIFKSDGTSRNEYNDGDRHLLDQEFAIDVTIRLSTGMLLTGQEKFLSADKARYNSLTVEYMQNPQTLETGDWFNLACQIYLCAYCNPQLTAFTKWVIVDWPMLALATALGRVNWQENANRYSVARASFKYLPFDQIPSRCIIAARFDGQSNIVYNDLYG